MFVFCITSLIYRDINITNYFSFPLNQNIVRIEMYLHYNSFIIHIFAELSNYILPDHYACENSKLTLQCPPGQRIDMKSANFGRKVVLL